MVNYNGSKLHSCSGQCNRKKGYCNSIIETVIKTSVEKCGCSFLYVLILSILAGMYIAFGSVLFTRVTSSIGLSDGLAKLVGGGVFCLGLILVVVAGSELFTGNSLLLTALLDRRATALDLVKNWSLVFLGNFIGSITVVALIYMAGYYSSDYDIDFVSMTIALANKKCTLSFFHAFFRGTGCNMLVCLAVWMCYGCKSVIDKIVAIIFPITAFVALGFEHCVANMYFIPAGILCSLQQGIPFQENSSLSVSIVTSITNNLIPVTLGNIYGGAIIAFSYWLSYRRNSR